MTALVLSLSSSSSLRHGAPPMPTASEVAVRQSSLKSPTVVQKRATVVARAEALADADPALVVAFLRARHPAKTAERVHADTGVSLAAVRKLLERASAPSFATLIRFVAAYGPDFLSAIMPHSLAWLDAAARAEERRRLERDRDRIAERLREHAA